MFGGPPNAFPPSITLVVSGTVRYADERQLRAFSETIQLKTEGGGVFYVASDIFRILSNTIKTR